MKEKERLKQLDRSRKIQEEIAEEEKLKSQLDRMQNQSDKEMKNKFQKQVCFVLIFFIISFNIY